MPSLMVVFDSPPKLRHPINNLESKGFRLSRTKTEYMRCGFSTTNHEEGEEVSLEGQVCDALFFEKFLCKSLWFIFGLCFFSRCFAILLGLNGLGLFLFPGTSDLKSIPHLAKIKC